MFKINNIFSVEAVILSYRNCDLEIQNVSKATAHETHSVRGRFLVRPGCVSSNLKYVHFIMVYLTSYFYACFEGNLTSVFFFLGAPQEDDICM